LKYPKQVLLDRKQDAQCVTGCSAQVIDANMPSFPVKART